jgi:hypothetical protein
MTRSVWKSYNPLRSHDFGKGRFLGTPEPGQLFVCRNCYRAFRYDPRTQRTWAVGRDECCSALEDSVNRRWLSEDCAGGPSDFDEQDSQLFGVALVSGQRNA